MFCDRDIASDILKKYLIAVFILFCSFSGNAQKIPGVIVAKAPKGSFVASPAIAINKPGSSFKTSPHHQRNVVMLVSSPDLINWTEHTKVLRWNEGKTITMEDKYAFQYLDVVFKGEDMIAVSRTAWNSVNYHDSNYITFHRFKNFRTMTMDDSPPDLADNMN